MLLGNEQAQDILSRYFARIKESDEITFPFLLLAGPQHVGKRYMIEPMVHDLVGMYGQTDYLPLYDLSYVTGKKHSVKIQVSEKDQRIEIEGKQYRDLGARDIVQRLSLSPVGKHKVLFIQNIERMTTQAANALLKTREEPLPGRLLIASTSHKDSLLDTILSRACVVQFQSVTTDAMENFLTSWYTDKTEEQRLFAASFAGGCP